jgi:hypothetical protein
MTVRSLVRNTNESSPYDSTWLEVESVTCVVPVQASQMIQLGGRHRSALRCLAKLSAGDQGRDSQVYHYDDRCASDSAASIRLARGAPGCSVRGMRVTKTSLSELARAPRMRALAKKLRARMPNDPNAVKLARNFEWRAISGSRPTAAAERINNRRYMKTFIPCLHGSIGPIRRS